MRLNENVFSLDLKTLRYGELSTVAGSAFQTIEAEQTNFDNFLSSFYCPDYVSNLSTLC